MKTPSRVPTIALTAICATFLVICNGADRTASLQSSEDYERARHQMVRAQLATGIFGRKPITSERVLEAMRTVPRHEFVPEAMRQHAYADSPLPIGHGQTISQPYIVATMTEAIHPEEHHKVLEIGTGSGYQAAVLAELVDQVYTIEIIPELTQYANRVLNKLEYTNVHTRTGDGYQGWPEAAPFDAIIVTAAPTHVPQPLVEQLKNGGRMIIPVGAQNEVQLLKLIEKNEDGEVTESTVDQVRFVPFTGEAMRQQR